MAKEKLLFSIVIVLLQLGGSRVVVAEDTMFSREDMGFGQKLTRRARIASLEAIRESWESLKNMAKNVPNAEALALPDLAELGEIKDKQVLLRIFVSHSMGKEQLKYYLQQAKKYNAALVFNGLPDGSWRKLSSLVYDITGGMDDEGAMQIDDLAFKEYGISSVPSFVLTREYGVFSRDYVGQDAPGLFDKVTGNIGVKRALELISQSGELADEALELLEL